MRKRIVLPLLILLGVTLFFVYRIQFYPFGFKAPTLLPGTQRLNSYLISENMPNTSIYSYKIDLEIKSKDDFINYLKSNSETYKAGSNMDLMRYELGSFMDNDKNVIWQKVYESVNVRRLAWKKIYSLSYKTLDPQCNGYKLEITDDGYVYDYRSAGE